MHGTAGIPGFRGDAALLCAAGALLLAASLPARAGERWLEVEASPGDAGSRERLLSLGWEVRALRSGAVRVYLPGDSLPDLERAEVPHRVTIPDLEAFFRDRLAAFPAARGPRGLPPGSMGGYLTLDEIVAFLDGLAAAHPSLLAAKVSIGTTEEGRDLWAWKLSANAPADEDEPELLIHSLQHAREPVGPMAVLHFADRLLAGYGADAEATWLLDHREIWLLPVHNPDGYAWNEAQNPGGGGMWRKNRRDNGAGTFGVDLNRNWGIQWGADDQGSSPNPGADTYRGPSAFSEAETSAIRDFTIARGIAIAVNTHAWGDFFLFPWAWSGLPSDEDAVYRDFEPFLARGNAYTSGTALGTLGYLANGEHEDWMHGETAAKPRVFSFLIEAGNEDDRFWPAPSRIAPIAAELEPVYRFAAWAAGAAPRVGSVLWDDAAGGDGDGVPEPGEEVVLSVSVRNHGLAPTAGPLLASLTSESCAAVVLSGAAEYGEVPAQSGASGPLPALRLRISPSASPGDAVSLRLTLSDGTGPYPAVPVRTLVGEPQVLFADDLEGGDASWNLSGWGLEAAGSGTPGDALSDSVAGAPPRNADRAAVCRQALDLTTFARAWLVFDHRFRVDNDFDAAVVEVSWDGGGSWAPVAGATSGAPSGAGAQTPGVPVYDGWVGAWTSEAVDLGPFCGPGFDGVLFRFLSRTNNTVEYDGWMVDNVRVLAFAPSPPPALPGDPSGLRVTRAGDDLGFAWVPAPPSPGAGPADAWALWSTEDVRGRGGFSARAASPDPAATLSGEAASPGSRAFLVTATNCAGDSGPPP